MLGWMNRRLEARREREAAAQANRHAYELGRQASARIFETTDAWLALHLPDLGNRMTAVYHQTLEHSLTRELTSTETESGRPLACAVQFAFFAEEMDSLVKELLSGERFARDCPTAIAAIEDIDGPNPPTPSFRKGFDEYLHSRLEDWSFYILADGVKHGKERIAAVSSDGCETFRSHATKTIGPLMLRVIARDVAQAR
jgi:hypothetical protein